MRRSLVVALVIGLVAALGAAPAEAGKKKKKAPPKKTTREATSMYEAPALGSGTGVCLRPTNSCGDFATGEGEFYLSVKIDDMAGLDVYFSLAQDTDPNQVGSENDLGEHCGATTEPIVIEPGFPVLVFPWFLGSPSCPGIGTRGTVTATFSNLP